MFDGLKKKWKVSGLQLLLILCTFAIGGSATGWVAKKLMNASGIEADWLWAVLYIIIITILWPVMVILISIPFGQFRFFSRYIRRLGGKMGIINKIPEVSEQSTVKHIAIFASGGGSNAQQIINYFSGNPEIRVSLVVCNKPGAGVLHIAEKAGIPTLLTDKEVFFKGSAYTEVLLDHNIDLLVLAGFLWKVPTALIKAFPNRIINIHPALLPAYGGKGMYGHHVHAAVVANHEKQSGITIHYVDEQYDHGQTIFQATCPVEENDTADTLAARVLKLEHAHYARVIEGVLKG